MKVSPKGGAPPAKKSGRRAADHGWTEGTVQDFLRLSDEEAALIRAKAGLAVMLQRRRKVQGWSQTALAERLGSGQSRIAKMEAAQPSVSLDLLVRGLLVAGATMTEIGSVIAAGDPNSTVRAQRPKQSRRAAMSS